VLIVGDDVSVTDAFSRALRLDGCEVWACPAAAEGLALARSHLPDLLIVDLRTTLQVSLRLAKAVGDIPRANGMTLTIAIATGDYAERPDPAELASLGVELHYRPVWLDELVGLARDRLAVPSGR
jgi:CheY-like chemotaxis protein